VSIAAVTLTGFVAMEPRLLFTKQTHTPVVNLRVGTTPRRVDVTTGEWRDLPSSFFTVNCWRRLAYSVSASLSKGDPVIIRGRLKSRTWNDNGTMRSAVDIEAESVGHDMSYGWAHFMKGLHPGTKDMLEKMGMTETPYGFDSPGELGTRGRPGAPGVPSIPGGFDVPGGFGVSPGGLAQEDEPTREYGASQDYGPAGEYPSGPDYGPAQDYGPAHGAARDDEPAEGEAEDSASQSDGALAAEEVPF
jgi:single-strand DNA-binding protein